MQAPVYSSASIQVIAGSVAGLLDTWIGVEATMWVGGIAALLAALPVLLSPLVGMRELPTAASEAV